ncbi:MAG: S16 family serine protease [Nanobdellota archaeon]
MKIKKRKSAFVEFIFYSTSLLLLIIILGLAFFQLNGIDESKVTLLAANKQKSIGSIAHSILNTETGNKKVYIENNVLSDIDTQLSIKMAKDIVCSDYADCKNKDFYYTINSKSSKITGPSGGLGFAVLTFAHTNDYEIPDDVSFTGTINSGGFIGNVGGIPQKIRAAKKNGIKKIYIPFGNDIGMKAGSSNNSNNKNNSKKVNILKIASDANVNIIESPSLDFVLNDLFGYKIKTSYYETPIDYKKTMEKISEDICSRAENSNTEIKKILSNISYIREKYAGFYKNHTNVTKNKTYDKYMKLTNITSYYQNSVNLLNKSKNSISNDDYYSSASYCFSSLMNTRYVNYLNKGYNTSLNKTLNTLKIARNMQKYNIDDSKDIQVYSVVQERINDGMENLKKSYNYLDENDILSAIESLSYANERFFTAISWSRFYNIGERQKIIDDSGLKNACIRALNEANSRYQYVDIYVPYNTEAKKTYEKAEIFRKEDNYPLCIYYSLQSKAQSDVVASTLGWNSKNISKLLDLKSDLVKSSVATQVNKGRLPILGISYLEYANSLKKENPYSSLLYYQMALEFSNLDLYLEKDNEVSFYLDKNMIFLLGLSLGLIIASIILRKYCKK